MEPSKVKNKYSRLLVLIGVLFILGVALRLFDVTDPPLDFHAWRQLRSASIARKFYYDILPTAGDELQEKASQLGSFEPLEPPIFERMVALAYRLVGQEQLWVARVLAIVTWVLGGLPLYLLARRLTSQRGAVVSLAYYLFLPFSVIVSRTFLPDVPMTVMMLTSIYFIYRWAEKPTLVFAVLAGLFSGGAILIKVFAAYPLVFVIVIMVLNSLGISKAIKNPQVWLMGILLIAIPGIYYFIIRSGSAASYFADWVFPFSSLMLRPWFYFRWAVALHRTITVPALLVAALSIFMVGGRGRLLLISLWLGYFFIGISVPSLIISHSYYQTILIPIAALSLAPFGESALSWISRRTEHWRALGVGVLLISIGFLSQKSITLLLANDYRDEVLGWKKMGRELPEDGNIIGLTHDYNTRLRYYGWTLVDQWPHATDFEMQVLAGGNYDPSDPAVARGFTERTEGYDYFLVTLYNELEQQKALETFLYETYSVTEGDGYSLFHLSEKKE
ncbi:MAG: glycosyltransferase family 39 protein [Anaerolineales bacterium]